MHKTVDQTQKQRRNICKKEQGDTLALLPASALHRVDATYTQFVYMCANGTKQQTTTKLFRQN